MRRRQDHWARWISMFLITAVGVLLAAKDVWGQNTSQCARLNLDMQNVKYVSPVGYVTCSPGYVATKINPAQCQDGMLPHWNWTGECRACSTPAYLQHVKSIDDSGVVLCNDGYGPSASTPATCSRDTGWSLEDTNWEWAGSCDECNNLD
eukprot:scpid105171/ scgid23996/ 